MRMLSSVQKTLVVTSIVVLVANVVVMGESPPASKDAVTIKLILPKKPILLGEKISVKMVARNSTSGKAKIALESLGWDRNNCHLFVQTDEGEPVEYIGASIEVLGPCWQTVPPGGQITRELNVTMKYKLEHPMKYRIRCYATVGKERVFSPWREFQIVTGKEAFRKDIKVVRLRPGSEAPKREDDSLIVYALPKVHLAYYKRTFQKGGKKTTTYKRLIEVDPNHKPQVLTDARGEVHILLARRQLPRNEIEKRFKDYPSTYKMHLRYRRYMTYKTAASDGRLQGNRRLSMAKEDKNELRLVEAANRTIEVHEFKDVGVYSHPWHKPKPRSRPSQRPGVTKTSDTPKKSP